MMTKKRVVSLLLALLLCLSLLPAGVLAEETKEEPVIVAELPVEPKPTDEEPAEEGDPALDGTVVASGVFGANDSLSWEVDDNNVLTISGAGAMPDFTAYTKTPWKDYRTTITGLVIGDGVTRIGQYAFASCTKLASATIGSGIQYFGTYAFQNCAKLTSVDIPNSVTIIDQYAFSDCTSLSDVWYGGTEEDWNEISIGDNNDPLLNATFHYGNAVPVIPNTYELDLSGVTINGSDVTGIGKVVNTAGNQAIPKMYVYIVVNYESENGTTWAVAGTYPVEEDTGEFDYPTIAGVTDTIPSVLVVGLDSKTDANWAGRNLTAPVLKMGSESVLSACESGEFMIVDGCVVGTYTAAGSVIDIKVNGATARAGFDSVSIKYSRAQETNTVDVYLDGALVETYTVTAGGGENPPEGEDPPISASTAKILGLNAYFADYFVLNLYVQTDVEEPTFSFLRETDNYTLTQVYSKEDFCSANKAVYYVEKVNGKQTNALGLTSTRSEECWMVSVKFFAKYLDQTVTLSMTDGADPMSIEGYGYQGFGHKDETAAALDYSLVDYTEIMGAWKGSESSYAALNTALKATAQALRSL